MGQASRFALVRSDPEVRRRWPLADSRNRWPGRRTRSPLCRSPVIVSMSVVTPALTTGRGSRRAEYCPARGGEGSAIPGGAAAGSCGGASSLRTPGRRYRRDRPGHPGLVVLEVRPTAEGAAPASIAYLGGADEVVVGFGRTHVYMWDDDHHLLAWEVRDLLEAVFTAKFVEAGADQDGYSKVSTRSGMKGVGKMHLPWPWRFRRTRTYSPYGPPRAVQQGTRLGAEPSAWSFRSRGGSARRPHMAPFCVKTRRVGAF